MLRSRGLSHIHLYVRDMRKSLEFYQSVFGMAEKFRVGDGLVFLNTPGALDLVTLHQAEAGDVVGQGGGIAHFGFLLEASQDTEAAIGIVSGAGGRVKRHGQHEGAERFMYIEDPDGYEIELNY